MIEYEYLTNIKNL